METLLRKIDQHLGDGRYDSDVLRAGKIWLDLSSEFRNELDSTQLSAIDVAHRYWAGKGDEAERLSYLQKLCDRMDDSLRSGKDKSRTATLNRIVAASLMTTTGLSHEAAEFIVELAERLGTEEADLTKIFARYVSEFEETAR